jgi:hypothetical protein
MSVRTTVRALLYYLGRYIKGNPDRKRRLLRDYKKRNGVEIETSQLYRHIGLTQPPNGEYLMFYLLFLSHEKAIRAPKKGEKGLFVYAHPELLKAKK